MECDICGKAGSHDHLLHCITCARSYLEQPRIELAKTLIDKDGVERHVKAVIQGTDDTPSVSLSDSKGGFLVDRQLCTDNLNWQRTRTETVEIQERMTLITEQASRLREQMQIMRAAIEVKQAVNAQRKSDLSSATYGIDSRRANELEKVQQMVKRMDYKSDKVHFDTIEQRRQLCTTSAKLAGLKLSKRRTKDGGIKEVLNIGPGIKLRIWDLRDMNDAPPDFLSASLAAVAQLLVRVAAYLGIRLPAEITLPHNGYPQPTIFSIASSYQGKKVPFPGTALSDSSSNSPEASRTLDPRVPLPKPRTLFIDRPLAHLSAEDPPAYSSFIEGVSLLAYNIAWLCRTQGMKDDFKGWEDVGPMGRNLYRLLILQETYISRRPENPLDKDMHAIKSSASPIKRAPVGFGQLSHATSHSTLNMAENAQYLSGWSLTPIKILDEMKAYLLAEQQAQEWDVLNQKEWEDMENLIAEDPVMVGDTRRNTDLDNGRSHITTTTANGSHKDDMSEGGVPERKKGTSGWTKVKSRSEEASKR
ncbi:UV radiation resistance protein and autophagy-related subunit 14-domain-containing protein [Boeremia exigua]|uniref:UV radiation resistance protein and autophagy-related subunit 14-domain-containing protein n=1 Tax=Boeremia exigua TaxID=749465 RepID=UPI001E8DE6FA|nr:UV radiation resistance protein and autophagy-related subunit 14-domain-containing protein [Boeremia exigua]KAH6637925.1 UV radiation resistance protein and autophagy-related subunit 14-domain-containing protein [Boeremia exigua]